jgi:hypothetical protein
MTVRQRSEIEILAYYIWERNGRLQDRALDHWLEAEYLVLTRTFVAQLESPLGAKASS